MPNTCYEDERFENLDCAHETFEHLTFTECIFTMCAFDTCTFTACTFRNCRFIDCTAINPVFRFCEMTGSIFEESAFIGVAFDQLANAQGVPPTFDALYDCHLKYCSFANMNLAKTDFASTAFQECLFETCELTASSFAGCELGGTQFSGCDLRKADFRDASAYAIDLAANRLKGAKFSFPEAVHLRDSLGIIVE